MALFNVKKQRYVTIMTIRRKAYQDGLTQYSYLNTFKPYLKEHFSLNLKTLKLLRRSHNYSHFSGDPV